MKPNNVKMIGGISYELIRSKRKTLALYIRDGRVEARAPLKMPQRDIEQFIASKEKWITGKLRNSMKQSAKREDFSLDYGSKIALRGEKYPISAKNDKRIGFDGECFYMPQNLVREEIKRIVIHLYNAIAKDYISRRAAYYAKLTGFTPAAVKINNAKTRWGSCSGKNSINFSWRLIMAGDDIIDYVVVHEIMHIKAHDHSRKFWAAVEEVLPDYEARKYKLKEFQKKLMCEDWD